MIWISGLLLAVTIHPDRLAAIQGALGLQRFPLASGRRAA
jgi:hypothetical protein